MTYAISLILIAMFSFLNPWWIVPIAAGWREIDGLVEIPLIGTGLTVILLTLFAAIARSRSRYRQRQRAAFETKDMGPERWLGRLASRGVDVTPAPDPVDWNGNLRVRNDAVVDGDNEIRPMWGQSVHVLREKQPPLRTVNSLGIAEGKPIWR